MRPRHVTYNTEEGIDRRSRLMLVRLGDETNSGMQGRKAAGGTAIRCGIELKVRGSIVIAIMIDGDLQEVSSGLTAQERRTPVVADAAGVPKVVTPVLDETRTDLALIKTVDADNAHLRIARRDLTISCPHIICGKDDGRDRQAPRGGPAHDAVAHVRQVREGAW